VNDCFFSFATTTTVGHGGGRTIIGHCYRAGIRYRGSL
jgi:hypothetical protein